MINTTFKINKISRSFSHAACHYDEQTVLHREVALALMRKIGTKDSIGRILDIGTGTGFLLRCLKDEMPSTEIVGVDFAKGMLEIASSKRQDVSFICGDAVRLPFKKEVFDVIVSNLAYQWVEDLTQAFAQVSESLKPQGQFCFTMFGRNTFKELFASLDDSVRFFGGQDSFPIQKLSCCEDVEMAMKQAGFQNAKVTSQDITVKFRNMFDLVRWIKSIGANSLRREAFVGRKLLNQANEFYSDNFSVSKGVFATLEIIFVEAVKNNG